jgi:uncharacterized linocin/CFP29 family protein
MNDLLRELAPVSEAAWKAIDDEARRTLKGTLAARRLVDFTGPLGWEASAVNVGRTDDLADRSDPPVTGLEARLRRVQPLVELRLPFELSRVELEAVARGSKDPDLDAVRMAAYQIAIAEDRLVFHGYPAAGIVGICDSAEHPALTLTEDYFAYHNVVAEAVHTLSVNGVAGPYAIALGPRCYEGLTKTISPAGFPLLEYVRRLLDGPIVSAPGVNGAVVLSQRGGDFELVVGQDFSVGYLDHTATTVRLYVQESLTFRMLATEAAVPMVCGAAKKGKSRAGA